MMVKCQIFRNTREGIARETVVFRVNKVIEIWRAIGH